MSIENLLALVPEQHRDMGIFKEADSVDVVFDRIGELNAYRGQSIRIPSEHASAEDFAEFDAKLQAKVPGLVRMPGADADDAARNAFYGQLGRPNEATGYVLPETPEGFTPNPEAMEALGKFAFEQGLSQKQFEQLASRELARTMAAEKAALDAKGETTRALKDKWGEAFESRKTLVKTFLDKHFPHNQNFSLESLPLADVLAFEKMAVAAAGEGGSGGEFGNAGQGMETRVTRDEAVRQINEIYGNQNHPYHNPSAPGYNDAQLLVQKLYKIKNGVRA